MNLAIDLNVTHVLDVSPRLEKLWQDTLDTLNQESLIVHTLDDFNAKLDQIEAAVKAPHNDDQAKIDALNAEVADLQAKLADGGLSGTDEQKILDRLDAIVASIPTPAPSPSPTPTPTPDEPTPTPEPTPPTA